jgi:hypothetical protein
MNRLILIPLITFVLAGCASPEERYARDVAKCKSYGFSSAPKDESGGGNDALANCMMQLDQNREAASNAASNAIQPYRPPQYTPAPFVAPPPAYFGLPNPRYRGF